MKLLTFSLPLVAMMLIGAPGLIHADEQVRVQSGQTWAQLASQHCRQGTSADALARYNGKTSNSTPPRYVKIPSSLSNSRSATLRSVRGDVKVNGRSASANQTLVEGNSIETGSNGHADVRLDDGSVMRVGPNSKLTLSKMGLNGRSSSTSTDLSRGSASMQVTRLNRGSSFSVSTVSAVAGVRGTYFYINYDENSKDVSIACYTGKVVVARTNADGTPNEASTVDVNAGYATTIQGDKVEQPFPIPGRIEWADEAAAPPAATAGQ